MTTGWDIGQLQEIIERSKPQTEGSLQLPGLKDDVEVIRDHWGVPHIYAHDVADLFFAQGFIHAQDRLWQMELTRRALSGRLSEVFGPLTLRRDRFARILGFRRIVEAEVKLLDDESHMVLKAYTRGVNAFLETHRDRLPPEFVILQFEPEPWAVEDCLLGIRGAAWSLASHWQNKLLREHLVEKLGPQKAAALEPVTLLDSLADVAEMDHAELTAHVAREYHLLFPQIHVPLGSNAWALDEAKTATGHPMLCNDPHLNPTMPSVWYQNHLVRGDFEAAGVTTPGVPGVTIGHNAHIAWGLTYGCADQQDIYVERMRGQHPPQYRFRGHWEDAQVLREEISVRGQPLFVEEVVITRHGPVISALLEGESRALALRWTGLLPVNVIRGVLELNRAANWSQFTEALRHLPLISFNIVYADRKGNIGSHMSGSVPIRAKGHGLLPVPGWTGEYEWEGYIPYDELPQALNPECHFVATANDKVEDYPYFLTIDWAPGFRIRRIRELMGAKKTFHMADLQSMQLDTFWMPGPDFMPQLLDLEPTDEEERQALAYLQDWDYRLRTDSVAATIFRAFLEEMRGLIFGEKLGDLADFYYGAPLDPSLTNCYTFAGISLLRAQELLQGRQADWPLESTWRPDRTGDLLHQALRRALDRLRRGLGPEMASWRWGRVHQVSFNHLLGHGMLRPLLSRGPYPVPGGLGAICAGPLVSYRQIVDLADWDRSVAVLPTGQSGHPASPHYSDLIELWLSGGYHPMLWSRNQVEQAAEAVLWLRAER